MQGKMYHLFKICLVGEGAVGKTCLIKRFVYDTFSDKYIVTMGTKITKRNKIITHPVKGTPTKVRMLIWDIMGQQEFRQKLPEAYFNGCDGALAVCDITRIETMSQLVEWIKKVHSVAGKVPIMFLANKCDLKGKEQLNLDDLKYLSSKFDRSHAFLTSAKTGENVELAFETLGKEILLSKH
jgi:small GTP-binding protein